MLIRSSQLTLERRRVPLGDLRVSEFARALNVRGLWIFSPRYLTVDLTGNSPPLTWQGSAAINGGIEGPGIDCSPSTTSGARLTFGSSSPLNITTGPGLSTYARISRTAVAQGSNAPYFGIGYQSWSNPFTISLIGTTGTTLGAPSWNWNTGGTLRQFTVFSDIWPAHTPTSFALSHAFGSRVDAYYAGRLHNSDTTNTAAPSYGGTSDILCFGYDGVNARNSQSTIFTGAVFAHPLSGSEAAALEAEPYSLVEQRPLFLSMLSSGGANVQGGLTATLGDLTATSTGTVLVTGTAANTLGDLTVASAGTSGAAAQPVSGLTFLFGGLLGAASANRTGELNATLGALTSSSAGTVLVTGGLTQTLDALTSSSAGTVLVTGSLGVTLGDLTSSATGTVASGPNGTLAVTLGDLTVASAGTVRVAGTLGVTLDALTATSAGTVLVTGSLNVTLGALTLQSSDNTNFTNGSTTATLGALTVNAAGTVPLLWTPQTPTAAAWTSASAAGGTWTVQTPTSSTWQRAA